MGILDFYLNADPGAERAASHNKQSTIPGRQPKTRSLKRAGPSTFIRGSGCALFIQGRTKTPPRFAKAARASTLSQLTLFPRSNFVKSFIPRPISDDAADTKSERGVARRRREERKTKTKEDEKKNTSLGHDPPEETQFASWIYFCKHETSNSM